MSKAFIKQYLEKFPEVQKFVDLLQKDNLTSYDSGRERGLSEIESVAQTPYGKVLTSLGFRVSDVHPVLQTKEVLVFVEREVTLDFYFPMQGPSQVQNQNANH